MISACRSDSDASPRDLKNSTVTLYLSEDDVEHWGRLRNRGRSRTRTSEGGIQGRALPRAFSADMSSLDEPDLRVVEGDELESAYISLGMSFTEFIGEASQSVPA
jgi:hypothetical protein